MDLDQALQIFFVECRELLDDMETSLLDLRSGADHGETINAIFRAAHTIKGSGGLFGLDALVRFTHVVESLLDELREGRVAMSDSLIALLLECRDHIGALVDAAEADPLQVDAALIGRGEPLRLRLCEVLDAVKPSGEAVVAPADAPAVPVKQSPGENNHWHISVRFGPDVLRNGMDPLSFIRYLGTLGTVTRIVTLTDALPALADTDPESCHLGFEIDLKSQADQATIEAVFDFVIDDCTLRVTSPATQAQPVPAPDKHKRTPDAKPTEHRSVRVDADKLDRLIDLVGELIIASAGASLIARKSAHIEALEANSVLTALVEEVRDSALQLRMVKVGATFNRFQRVVHDVSRELGKDIVLVVSGEDTELDKTVVEKIGDPLTHLVRNAIDHGIDSPELRLQRGKPAQGTVRLNAYHDSGSIVIEVSDDGGGLDRERIVAKALERGLIDAGKPMSDAEAYALIFEPGFSTAEKVTNLSGRGVGMDVVKRNIAALRGSVAIASTPGRGTTVSVRLPLTLAIINGFQVSVGSSVFVVPLDVVEECVEYTADGDNGYTDLRGQVLPFIRLRDVFGVRGPVSARPNIVVVQHAGQRCGLVVDGLLGEAQTVIKPLSKLFGEVSGVSGSTILGNGDVALIVDVPALMQRARATELARAGAAAALQAA